MATPHLDRLAAMGVRFASHYSQAVPCAPGRAALYTGTYQMKNRVVANGSPLEDHFDNVARLARRAGYRPLLFGYTDQGVDPAIVPDPSDPRLDTYEGILPGFEDGYFLDGNFTGWREHLSSLGYGELSAADALRSEPERPAEHSAAAFLTDQILSSLAEQTEPWFFHASYLRPHSPYAAAGEFSDLYSPEAVPPPIAIGDGLHPLHEFALQLAICAAPPDPEEMARLRAQYYGMVSEVDAEIGRLLTFLEESGQLDETMIVVTADHGEQLGDHGLIEKLGFFEESYRIPLILFSPHHRASAGRVVEQFTEAIDVLPTFAQLLGHDVPLQCDGYSLLPFLNGEEPSDWRTAAHYEYDWRSILMGPHRKEGGADRALDQCNLAVLRTADFAYVQFGDGSSRCFDLAEDPTWLTTTSDPAVVLPLAQEMLAWRSRHLGGRYSQLLLSPERKGVWTAS